MLRDLAKASASLLSPLPSGTSAPAWIMVMPAGPALAATDGRKWTLTDPAAVASASMAAGLDLPIDWEHAQDARAPEGHRADAAGWITALEARDGAIWAQVTWTDEGAASVASRGYRYISPAFLHDKDGERCIRKIIGAGLVNRPAFPMPALAREDDPIQDDATPKETDMDKDILEALGLPADATKAQALTAIATARSELSTARTAADTPPVERFMPRADYDQVLARATAAEQALKDRDDTEAKARVEALVEDGVKAGKIAPSSRAHYLALASKDFASVEALLKTAPAIVGKPGLDPDLPKTGAGALTDDEKALCRQLNLTEEAFAATKAQQAA